MNTTEPGFECPECSTRLFSASRCQVCGWKRSASPDEAPKTSCWTCDACGSRTPGQPVMYQDDGPGESPRGLCSGCHFDLRIRPTVRAPIEDVHAHVVAIGQMVDRLTRRMETVRL